ncbi:MAG: DNA-formamidopyrimidine glycosylase [Spirochaetae bacterium HGW-Spirochaetae-2]|nr:MAG: DNA-formamidopyrimidine glycosylase [Spirochaetae bacterium HGW-Spirochaetae-2]
MPELPEVETVCRDLRSHNVVGVPIEEVSVLWERSIGSMGVDDFYAGLTHRSIEHIDRRGKYIHIHLDDRQSLLIHLRMSGSLSVRKRNSPPDIHDRIILRFASSELVFHDPRKFGRMLLTRNPAVVTDRLGPEPLSAEFTETMFYERLHRRRGRLKSILLDQSFIAGIGNIYADESLFIAGLHPCRTGADLSRDEASALLHAIRFALNQGIESRGTSLGDGEGNFASGGRTGSNGTNLHVFRRTDLPCPRCSTKIERIVVGQRSTHFCPNCQKRKKNSLQCKESVR